MTTETVYPYGMVDLTVASGESIAVSTYGNDYCTIYYGSTAIDHPVTYYIQQHLENGSVTLGSFSAAQPVRIVARADKVFYATGSAPVVTTPTQGLAIINQGAPTAATTSATLTAAEVIAGIITVNQGGSAASAQQLPLATAMDTALPDFGANDSFDFSVINISTDAAEDASITTNTGWTLVGNMDVASNAAATDKSAGHFRARKTAAGAWTLYRMG